MQPSNRDPLVGFPRFELRKNLPKLLFHLAFTFGASFEEKKIKVAHSKRWAANATYLGGAE